MTAALTQLHRSPQGGGGDLLAAIERNDVDEVKRLWGDVWHDLATVARPKQGCTIEELADYARHLGHVPQDDIRAGIRETAGAFRPTPGEILAALRMRATESKVDVGRGRDRTLTEVSLRLAARTIATGRAECSCGFRRNTWQLLGWPGPSEPMPEAQVPLCIGCGGLDPGQVYEAERAGLLGVAA